MSLTAAQKAKWPHARNVCDTRWHSERCCVCVNRSSLVSFLCKFLWYRSDSDRYKFSSDFSGRKSTYSVTRVSNKFRTRLRSECDSIIIITDTFFLSPINLRLISDPRLMKNNHEDIFMGLSCFSNPVKFLTHVVIYGSGMCPGALIFFFFEAQV